MKLFIDTANIEEIRQANAMGVLDGVTQIRRSSQNGQGLQGSGERDFQEIRIVL